MKKLEIIDTPDYSKFTYSDEEYRRHPERYVRFDNIPERKTYIEDDTFFKKEQNKWIEEGKRNGFIK